MGGGYAAGTSRIRQSSLSSSLQTVDYLEQWHDSMSEAGRYPLNRLTKGSIRRTFPAAAVASANPTPGYQFRRVTTEKKEDFPWWEAYSKYKEKKKELK